MRYLPDGVTTPLFTFQRQVKATCNQPECDWETVYFDGLHDQKPADMAREHMTDAHGVLYGEDAVKAVK